jgi:hypothetical protein
VRPVGELGKEIESVAAAGDARLWPAGGRLALALGLATLGWAVPLYVLYLLW